METINTEYYRIEIQEAGLRPRIWSQWAYVIRKDSSEQVGWLSAEGDTAENCAHQLMDAIAKLVPRLEKPADWGRDPIVQRLVSIYYRFREEEVQLYERVRRGHSQAHLEEIWERELPLLRDTHAWLLSEAVNATSEEQKILLVTFMPEEIANGNRVHIADKLLAKSKLAELINKPSARVNTMREAFWRKLPEVIDPTYAGSAPQ